MANSRELEQTNDGTGVRRLSKKRTNERDLTRVGDAMEAVRQMWRKNRTAGKVVEIPKAPGGEK